MNFYPSAKTSELYFKLPSWCREEMRNCSCGFSYSGFPALGWSWFGGFSTSSSAILSSEEILPSEPDFYLPFYEDILSGVEADLELESWLEGEETVLLLSFLHGEAEELTGRGEDRLEAMVSLLGEVCSFYMSAFKPSLSDASSEKFLNPYLSLGLHLFNGSVKTPSETVDVFSDRDGRMSLGFSSYNSAMSFSGFYRRFMADKTDDEFLGMLSTMAEHCFGEMDMVEGKVMIYSCYGLEETKLATTNHNHIGRNPYKTSMIPISTAVSTTSNNPYTFTSGSTGSIAMNLSSNCSGFGTISSMQDSMDHGHTMKATGPVGTGRLKHKSEKK